MSNQRSGVEEKFDPQGFNFQAYLQQNVAFPSMQGNMQELDSQYQQNTITGRYTPGTSTQADTFRTQALGNPLQGFDMKQQYGANLNGPQNMSQFSALSGQQQKQLDLNMMAGGRLPQKDLTLNLPGGISMDGSNTNQFSKPQGQFDQFNIASQMLPGNMSLQQQQLLQLELLKMQQTPSSQNLLMQNQQIGGSNPQLFGAGFLNAAQLLASAQQLSQPTISNPGQNHIQNDKMQNPAQGAGQMNQNVAFLSNLNNIYSNLNHYQTLIDSIEKSNPQQNFNNNMSATKSPIAQQTPSYMNQNYQMQQMPSINMSGNNYHQENPIMPLQQNLQKQNLYDLPDTNQSINYMTSMGSENDPTSKGSQFQPFSYDQKPQSRERQYNPNQYNQQQQQQQPPQQNNNRSFSSDYNYAKTISQQQPKVSQYGGQGAKYIDEQNDYKQTEHYIQKSPPKQTSQSYGRGRENQSPSSQNFKPEMQTDPNESFNYLKFQNQNNPQHSNKFSNQNSPGRGGQNKRNYMDNDIGSNDLMQQSFRNVNHNNSQGSNSILQEQHLNTFQNRNNQNSHQYSPSGSLYKNDYNNDNHHSSNQLYSNGGMKSNRPINIDDMPIHAPKAKNFEELLESNLKSMGIDPSPIEDNLNDDSQKPKREFLKRKSKKPEVVAPAQTKKYNYYVDNFDGDKKQEREKTNNHDDKDTAVAVGFRSHHKQQEAPTTRNSNHDPHPSSHSQSRPNGGTPHHNQREQQNDMAQTERQMESNNQNQSKPKKKFLTRGTGTAGGRKGFEKSQSRQQTQQQEKLDQTQQEQQKNRTAKFGQKKTPTPLSDDDNMDQHHGLFSEQDNKSPRPQTANQHNQRQQMQNKQQQQQNQTQRMDNNHLARNSIMEFEKLEQECIDKYSPNNVEQMKQKKAAQNNNKRKKKLFDDSDSNEDDGDNDDYQQQQEQKIKDDNVRLNQYQSGNNLINQNDNVQEDAPKSSIVKRFFIKEDPQPSRGSAKNVNGVSQQPASAGVSEEMERMVQQKVDQLNKAMEKFNTEQEFHNRKRQEYEKLIQKAQVEKREFETLKKKAFEEIDRLKEEELNKIKKEKKTLEQRSKNLQLVGSSNKKEREEIDNLKKELNRVVEESKAKEQKQKMTIDRLKKQVEDLSVRNKELSDELRHHEQMRLQGMSNTQQSSTQGKTGIKQPTTVANQSQQQQRYTFNNQQEQQQQQPKGILKNKNESQKSNNRVDSPDQDQDYQNDSANQSQDDNRYVDEADDPTYEQSQNQGKSKQDLTSQYQQHQREQQQQQQQQQILQQQQKQLQEQQRQQQEQEALLQQQKQIAESQNQNQQDGSDNINNKNEEEEEDYDMKFPAEYHNKTPPNMKVIEQIIGNDGKIQRLYENGKKEVIFNNGVKREVFPDGYTIVYFNNNDIKQTYADSKVVYYFADAKTTQTTFPDGLQVFKFANNQVEKHFPDGTKEIIFPDGTIKCIYADGEEESIFPDGTIQKIEKTGVKAIEFANGQKDILFPDGTRIREFPDGRVRKTYPDGTFENTYRQQ